MPFRLLVGGLASNNFAGLCCITFSNINIFYLFSVHANHITKRLCGCCLRKLFYRVVGTFVNHNKTRMNMCDPGGVAASNEVPI